MDIHHMTEIAYKNGYEQGMKDAVTHGRWISVKDKLPDHCVTVLSYNGCAISTDFYDKVFQCWNSEILYQDILHVTHWMPLPERPNADRGNG